MQRRVEKSTRGNEQGLGEIFRRRQMLISAYTQGCLDPSVMLELSLGED
jgi:hypothetical protein